MRQRMTRKPTKILENETLAERKVRLALSSRGKTAETKVQDIFSMWMKEDLQFDFDRLLDSKAAGKIVAAQVSDFLLFYKGVSATIEVKEMKKGVRLPKKSFPQHPRMVRRSHTGCQGYLIAHTVDTGLWWVATVDNMELGATSWVLPEVGSSFATAKLALIAVTTHMLDNK